MTPVSNLAKKKGHAGLRRLFLFFSLILIVRCCNVIKENSVSFDARFCSIRYGYKRILCICLKLEERRCEVSSDIVLYLERFGERKHGSEDKIFGVGITSIASISTRVSVSKGLSSRRVYSTLPFRAAIAWWTEKWMHGGLRLECFLKKYLTFSRSYAPL